MNIAIVGATWLVGRKIIDIIVERNLKVDNFFLFADESEKDRKIKIFNKEYSVESLCLENLKGKKIDYAFFAVESEIAKKFAPIFARRKIVVIDNSNAYRRISKVPLVVPQVNKEDLKKGKFIFSNPNCSTIQLVTALKPLHEKFKIKRVVVSTYQAVSGAGKGGIDDLLKNTTKKFIYPICRNLIPQIDYFKKNNYTNEEDKLIFETKKILSFKELKITATAVRVPVLNCHSESVNIEFEKNVNLKQIKSVLSNSPNIVVLDDTSKNIYPMPIVADNKDEVFVGRIRKDYSKANTFNLFIVADNLRRGASSNAVDIFENLIKLKGR